MGPRGADLATAWAVASEELDQAASQRRRAEARERDFEEKLEAARHALMAYAAEFPDGPSRVRVYSVFEKRSVIVAKGRTVPIIAARMAR